MQIISIIKDGIVIFIITFILGLSLSAAKIVTEKPIAISMEKTKMKAFKTVCEGYNRYDDITDSVLEILNDTSTKGKLLKKEAVLKIYDESDNFIGYIVQCYTKGYGGNLNLIVGFDLEGKITGVQFANTPSETPGVGMKITKDKFLNTWKGHDKNNVEEVDVISGATESSEAFKQAVTLACIVANKIKEEGI